VSHFVQAVLNGSFPLSGPLSSANGALPWIVFERDKVRCLGRSTQNGIQIYSFVYALFIFTIRWVSMKELVPVKMYKFFVFIEKLLNPWMQYLGMFGEIVLIKNKSIWISQRN
jgi:hypothetical protein